MSDYLKTGYLERSNLKSNFPPHSVMEKHSVAMTECVQEIPCNPCVTICPTRAITMRTINSNPEVDFKKCIGCGKCVAVCPGLAMFMMKINGEEGEVSLPYEIVPQPQRGEVVKLLNREGKIVSEGIVVKVVTFDKNIHSSVVTVEFKNSELVYEVRNIEVKNERR